MYMILITVLNISFVLLCFAIFFIIRKSKSKSIIYKSLNSYGPTKASKKCYDYLVDTKDCYYCVKVIYNFNKYEISLNNKNHWNLNDKVVSSKKSGAKLEGIYDLVNENLEFDKPHKKVYLVYPDSKILVKAVNESEIALIHPNMDCYGVNVVKFKELDEVFKK